MSYGAEDMKNHGKEKGGRYRSLTVMVLLTLILSLSTISCRQNSDPQKPRKVWTEAELNGLKGRTREEVRDALGEPSGLLTVDAKGRWEYPNLLISAGDGSPTHSSSLLIYFSEQGERRVTIVDFK